MNKIQNYINHIVFVVDKSGSMRHLESEVVKVFDSQIKHLAQRSQELDQETRVSVYLFNDKVECLIYDKDVMRLPSLKNYYNTNGGTALIDGVLKAIEDLEKVPQLYGDHSVMILSISDGEENSSINHSSTLTSKINSLLDNWTMGALVPDQQGVYESIKFGFPKNNISVWNTNVDGINEISKTITQVTDTYMVNRSRGIRGTKSLFNVDTSLLNTKVVNNVLDQLKPNEYELLSVHRDSVIKDFVESWTGKPLIKGSAYYQLVKSEEVQAYKQICIQDKKNGKVYGGTNARRILALPNYEVKVNPVNFGNYDIFIQSTSYNRKLASGTKLIVLK